MDEYYYEINKSELQYLEQKYGVPPEIVQVDYNTCVTSMDGVDIIFSSTKPLNIGLFYMDAEKAKELIGTEKYSAYDF